MNFKPMEAFLVVQKPEAPEMVNGVFLPQGEGRQSLMAHEGPVLAVGPGRDMKDGTYVPTGIEVGDYVYWNQHAGVTVKVDGEDLFIIHVSDIIGTRPDAPKGQPTLATPELADSGV